MAEGSWNGSCTWETMDAAFPNERGDSLLWDSKMAFWTAAIRKYCSTQKTAVFNHAQLLIEFQKYGRTPKCLGTVIQDMVRRGLARRLSLYLEELDPDGSNWSLLDLVKRPLSWLRMLFSTTDAADQGASGNKDTNDAPDEELYALVDLVKVYAEDIHNLRTKSDAEGSASSSSATNLISYGVLMQQARPIVVDEPSFRLALLHLSQHNRCSITHREDGHKIVRLVDSGDEALQPSSVELHLFRLRELAGKLETSIEDIAKEMARYKESAKESLKNGNQREALRFLNRKKQLEQSVAGKEQILNGIIAQIATFEQTESRKQALDVYRCGIEIYKTTKDNSGLSVDEIDQTMLTMQEMLDDSHELEKTMAFSPLVNGTSDDELKRELDELLEIPSQQPLQFSTPPTDAVTGDGMQRGVAIPAPTQPLKRRSSPRATTANKSSLQFPAVPSKDPQHDRPVKIQFGNGRKTPNTESSEVPVKAVKRRNVGKSPNGHQPLGVARKCEAQ